MNLGRLTCSTEWSLISLLQVDTAAVLSEMRHELARKTCKPIRRIAGEGLHFEYSLTKLRNTGRDRSGKINGKTNVVLE